MLQLDASRRYHIGSGQAQTLFLLGDRQGILTAQLEFARNNPNIVYELQNQIKKRQCVIAGRCPPNVFVCWSMNTPAVIHAEEHGTASLDDRIATACKWLTMGLK